MTNVISPDAIVYDKSIYPRSKPSTSTINEYADALASGAQFPPIILEKETNKLLDGYHRWKAYLKCQKPEQYDFLDNEKAKAVPRDIPCEYHTVPENITPRLYALYLSSRNGLRPRNSDKEIIAQEQYNEYPGTPISIIAKYIGVSCKTAKKFIESLVAEYEETKRSIVMRLSFLGWSQDEISNSLESIYPNAKGTSQQWVADFLPENGKFQKLVKSDWDKGLQPGTVAQRYNLPEILAWHIGLSEYTDQQRMEKLGIKVQPYDFWNFGKCHDLFGSAYPGRIPGQLVAHVLYHYSDPGAMIVDPMAGSGTTIDVCLAMGRKCYAFDMAPKRLDIIEHDLKDGWHNRVKKADLIFWDPPYFSKKDEGYVDGSISGLDRQEYLSFFSERLLEAHALVKQGTRLAFLMSDWNDEETETGIFLWDYADIIHASGWELIRQTQVPLSTQSVHPDIVEKFRAAKRQARLARYLLLAKA